MDYKYLFYIKKCVLYKDQEREFLSRLLFNCRYQDDFSLNRAMIELSFISKLKRSFNSDKTKSQLLIYWASPIKITRIFTDLIQILDSKLDKEDYDVLTQSEKFIIIGGKSIARFTNAQAQYINRLIASTPLVASNTLSQKSKSDNKICNHHKDYNTNKSLNTTNSNIQTNK
jgi:hypothetical protein